MLNLIMRLGMVISCLLMVCGIIISAQNGNTAALFACVVATAAIVMVVLSDIGR